MRARTLPALYTEFSNRCIGIPFIYYPFFLISPRQTLLFPPNLLNILDLNINKLINRFRNFHTPRQTLGGRSLELGRKVRVIISDKAMIKLKTNYVHIWRES